MKKILYALTILFTILACGDAITENTMIVSGHVKGLKKGTLYLQHVSDTTLVILDSLQVDGNGSFKFQTELESPEIFYLYLNKKDGNNFNDLITFFGEPGAITINSSWDNFERNAEITGAIINSKFIEFKKYMSNFDKRNIELIQQSMNSDKSLDSTQLDSLKLLNDKNTKRAYLFAINYAITNKNSYLSPYIAINEIPDTNVKYLDSIHNSLTPSVANSKYGLKLKKLIAEIKNN